MLKNIFFISIILGVSIFASAHHLDDDTRMALRFRYDETSGTLNVNDTSANRHVGTLNNFGGNPFGPGQRINQIIFDGTNDFITVPDANSLDLSAITMIIWASGNVGDGDKALFRKDGAYSMYVTGGSVLLADGNGPGSVVGTTTIHDNVRYFFGYTYDGVATQRLYINGTVEAVRSTSGTVLPNANQLNIGRFEDGTGFWNGTQDEARLLSAALTPQEMSNIYTFERGEDIGAQTITLIPTITTQSLTVTANFTGNVTGNTSMAEILDAVEILGPIFVIVLLVAWAEQKKLVIAYLLAAILSIFVTINLWERFAYWRIIFIAIIPTIAARGWFVFKEKPEDEQ